MDTCCPASRQYCFPFLGHWWINISKSIYIFGISTQIIKFGKCKFWAFLSDKIFNFKTFNFKTFFSQSIENHDKILLTTLTTVIWFLLIYSKGNQNFIMMKRLSCVCNQSKWIEQLIHFHLLLKQINSFCNGLIGLKMRENDEHPELSGFTFLLPLLFLHCFLEEWLSSLSDIRSAFFEYQSKPFFYIRFIIELGLELNKAALEKLSGKWWNMARKMILDGLLCFASKALQDRDAFRTVELYKLSMPSFGPKWVSSFEAFIFLPAGVSM